MPAHGEAVAALSRSAEPGAPARLAVRDGSSGRGGVLLPSAGVPTHTAACVCCLTSLMHSDPGFTLKGRRGPG